MYKYVTDLKAIADKRRNLNYESRDDGTEILVTQVVVVYVFWLLHSNREKSSTVLCGPSFFIGYKTEFEEWAPEIETVTSTMLPSINKCFIAVRV